MALEIWTPIDEDSVKSLALSQNQVTGRKGRFCNFLFSEIFENAVKAGGDGQNCSRKNVRCRSIR